MAFTLKSYLPRSVYGRAALILILPVVFVQVVVSVIFIQRHFDGVTRQLSRGAGIEVGLLVSQIDSAADLPQAQARRCPTTSAGAIRTPSSTTTTAFRGSASPTRARRVSHRRYTATPPTASAFTGLTARDLGVVL